MGYNEVLVCFTDKGLISTRILWKSPFWTANILQQKHYYHYEEKNPSIPATTFLPSSALRENMHEK